MTQFIFGYGTGRCGTQSLAHLLNLQQNSCVSHEMQGIHWWPVFSNYVGVKKRLAIREAKKYDLVGDIAYGWIQYIPQVIEDFPNAKFIHIWRDKDEVVESFWKAMQDRINAIQTSPIWGTDTLWYSIYPFLGFPPSKVQIANTYEVFHKIAEMAMFKYPYQIYTIKMESLNKTDSIKSLLDYVGIASSDQVVKLVRANKGGQSPLSVNLVPRADITGKYKCNIMKM